MNLALAIFALATGSLSALLALGWWGMLIFGGAGMPAAILALAGTVYALFALPLGIRLRSTSSARRDGAELSGEATPSRTHEFGVRTRPGGRVRFLSPVFLLLTAMWWTAAVVTWICYAGTGQELREAAIPIAFGGVMTGCVAVELVRRRMTRR